jgi:hypothetical protein
MTERERVEAGPEAVRAAGGAAPASAVSTPAGSLLGLQQAAGNQATVAYLQRKGDAAGAGGSGGGLPAPLRSAVEALSGLSLGDVKVHYNSTKPAQLNAVAFTDGRDIHLAAGQESHLAHEAWHVVQQAQGRAKPPTQGQPMEAEPALEQEADTMASRAEQQASKAAGPQA